MAFTPAVLSRRRLLQLGVGAGAGLLAACRSAPGPELLLAEADLPAAWLKQLPAPWRTRQVADAAAVQKVVRELGQRPAPGLVTPGLVALSDGWASGLSRQQLQSFEAPRLWARLAAFSAPVARLYGPVGEAQLAFPWAYSPWVIALRSRPDLAARRQEGWQLLLDPSLRGRLVLPSSPRISLEIMGGDFERLERLRAQALAYDDRDGLNLLLSGDAEAAVLPLQRLIPLLRRDQRLAVIWPDSGAPLSWQLLLRPAGAAQSAPPPLEWLGAVLEQPQLEQLLARGLVPPLPQADLAPVARRFPESIAALLLPGDGLLQRCWSLPPLSVPQQLAQQNLWDAAAPRP
ncbi:twin-arginine translocation pathway signal [Cyanobium sp. BA5m-21]|uniref:twin-arginine translocation pathway signal n=1 Tax=unclassified Cyanobium TaxID=2627006 RepID=UPI0020CBF414|nr:MULTISPECIES: twin-arginine translocation pathway signal [unclassified Cyanobium]MCP9903177.1 twin-arginine translocation pathway signal [Cyanobium sp. BA5m-10]MCP9906426.1 twin-arginine translocation pathway signal [Cyanobium sp. BA5m-21]